MALTWSRSMAGVYGTLSNLFPPREALGNVFRQMEVGQWRRIHLLGKADYAGCWSRRWQMATHGPCRHQSLPVALLPSEQMLSWGWRIPFLLSIVVLGIAYFVRTRLDETPVFEEAKEDAAVVRLPAAEVVRHQWKDILRVMVSMMFSLTQTLFSVFALRYGVDQGIPRETMLMIAVVAVGASMLTIPMAGALSDRIGRKKSVYIAHVGVVVTLFFYFWTLSTGNVALAFLGAFLNMSVFYSFWNGVWPVYFAEMFAAPVRYTGSAMGNQLGLLVAGFAPAIAAGLLGTGIWGWIPVALFATGITVAAFIAVLTSRETAHVHIDDLGVDYTTGRPVVEQAAARGVPTGA